MLTSSLHIPSLTSQYIPPTQFFFLPTFISPQLHTFQSSSPSFHHPIDHLYNPSSPNYTHNPPCHHNTMTTTPPSPLTMPHQPLHKATHHITTHSWRPVPLTPCHMPHPQGHSLTPLQHPQAPPTLTNLPNTLSKSQQYSLFPHISSKHSYSTYSLGNTPPPPNHPPPRQPPSVKSPPFSMSAMKALLRHRFFCKGKTFLLPNFM